MPAFLSVPPVFLRRLAKLLVGGVGRSPFTNSITIEAGSVFANLRRLAAPPANLPREPKLFRLRGNVERSADPAEKDGRFLALNATKALLPRKVAKANDNDGGATN